MAWACTESKGMICTSQLQSSGLNDIYNACMNYGHYVRVFIRCPAADFGGVGHRQTS